MAAAAYQNPEATCHGQLLPSTRSELELVAVSAGPLARILLAPGMARARYRANEGRHGQGPDARGMARAGLGAAGCRD
jgi:hypothetical protein